AFEWLHRAYEERAEWVIYVTVDPRLNSLRSDARFRDIVERVGLKVPAGRAKAERGKAIDSLAILPLVNADGDANLDYLSDGITESLINTLSQLPGLKVMAWSTVSRYKGKEVDSQAVGRELKVGAVFTGRVLQFEDRIVIRTEMVNVADGTQLWGR